MSAPVRAADETLFLICPDRLQIYAFSPDGLTRGQASKRELENDHLGELVLSRDGSLRRIDKVVVTGPYGESGAARMLSRLSGAHALDVTLSEPLDMPYADLRELIIRCVDATGMDNDPETLSIKDKVITLVRNTDDVASLFQSLNPPPPDEALDGL